MAGDKSLGFDIFARGDRETTQAIARVGDAFDKLAKKLDELDAKKASPEVDPDTAKATAKIDAFSRDMQRRIDAAVRALPDIELKADSSEADRKVAEIKARLDELRGKQIGVDLDAGQAMAEVAAIKADLDEVARKNPNVQLRVDAAQASAELEAFKSEVDRLDGRNAKVNVDVGGNATWMLSGISAAALGIAAAVVPGTAALAALSTVGAGAAATLGTLFAAFSGVGDGVKALDTFQKQQAASAVTSAAQQVSAANSIASAQDQVKSAIRGVEDAQRAAGIANANAAQQVQSAVDGEIRAEESLVSAQHQELSAQQALLNAQQALTDARKAAQRQLEDYAAQSADGALAEQQAVLDVTKAQQDLDAVKANPAATELERLQAQLTYDQAVQHLSDQRLQNKQLAEDKAAADQAGVEGSKQVQQAQQGVAAATTGVADAQRGVVDAQRGVAQAATALQAAQANQAETQRQGLENIAKASEQVVQSQRSLQTALAQSGAQGSQAIGTLNFAMSQLSPAGQQFAHFLEDEMIPGLHQIRDSVQAALLPQLEVSMRNLGTLTPELSAGLTQTAQVIGDLSVKGSMMMTSGPWRADFATIMQGNNRALSTFGDAGLSLLDVWRNLAVEAIPLVQRIADMTKNLAAQGQQWLQTKRDTGELAQFFKDAGDQLMVILHAAGQVAIAAIQLSQALAPLGLGVVSLVGDLAQFIGWLSQVNPLLAQIVAVGIGVIPIIGRLGSAFDALGTIWRTLSATNISTAIENAALSAGVATEKLVGMAASSETAAAAGTKVAAAGEKVSGALGKMGAALPIVGVALIALDTAWNSAVTSLDDGTRAMLEGGAAAAQMKAKVDDQLTGFGNWLNGMLHFAATSDDMTAAMHKQLDAMDPLHRAQAEAAQAQNDYLLALSKGPAGAAAATDAQQRFANANAEVTRQQDLLNHGLTSVTDALNAQRDAFLGALDGEIRYKDAAAAVSESIKQNGVSIDINTDAGRRNVSAWEDMARAAVADIDAMTKQGASQDDITTKAATYRKELFDSAIQIGMTRDQAQQYVDTLHLGTGVFPASMALDLGMSQVEAQNYVSTLHGGMGVFPATMTLNTDPATIALQNWINSAQSRQVVLQVSADTGSIVPGRAAGGIDVRPMAGGGFRASVVPANTPTLIGDHPYVNESYIPWDNSASSLHITDITAASQGRRVVPMADGGTVGVDTSNTADLFAGLTNSAQNLADAGLKPLADELTGGTVPALQLVQQAAGQDTPDALKSLTSATRDCGDQAGRVWVQLAGSVTDSTYQMRRAMYDLQTQYNAAWSDMTNQAGAAVGQIVGPQMGSLHGGLDAISAHAANTADGWGTEFGRLIPLTGDPIRWSLQYPVNAGLVGAWNAINSFFALNRPMGPVPIGFAGGAEDHRAVIAEPGTPRLWNEPETGGEAYIPLSPAKRASSSQILGQVAKRFHFNLVPMADGGIIEPYFNDTRRMIGDIAGFFGPGDYPGAMVGLGNTAVAGATSAANQAMAVSVPSGGSGVEQWRPVGLRALAIAGQDPSNIGRLLMQMGTESGGRTDAINRYDVNWQKGTPSVGLMQVIGPTYAHYKHPQFDVGPYAYGVSEDPLSNVLASTRYTLAAYGSLAAGWQGHGYDTGGMWPAWTSGVNMSGRPERVLSPDQTAAFERLVDYLGTRRGMAPITLSAPQVSAVTGAGGALSPTVLAGFLQQVVGQLSQFTSSLDGAQLQIIDDGHNGLARITNRQNQRLARR